jgi:hypothetical protein
VELRVNSIHVIHIASATLLVTITGNRLFSAMLADPQIGVAQRRQSRACVLARRVDWLVGRLLLLLNKSYLRFGAEYFAKIGV